MIATGPALFVVLLALAAPAAGAEGFGHRRYRETPAADLTDAGAYRATGRIVRLTHETAAAWSRLVDAARRDGVRLVPISGFRTVAYQQDLFRRAVAKHGSPRGAARWVAPPGRSEHHTGRALDLGDETRPDTDVEQSFETTPAYRWLQAHAGEYGFELSFPNGNAQGVSHEPWHWRHVGTDDGRRLFHGER